MRALCVVLPSQVFRDLGAEPPLEGGPGFHDFTPTTVSRAETLRIIDAIPPQVVRHYAFCGTPAQVAEQLHKCRETGLRHIVMWHITPFGDPSLARWSFEAKRELRKLVES